MGPLEAIGGVLAPKTPSVPAPQPVTTKTDGTLTPDRKDPEIQQAAVEARRRARARLGRGSTIATSALGDTSAAPVARKQLLGA